MENDTRPPAEERRAFLRRAGTTAGALLVAVPAQPRRRQPAAEQEAEVTPGEDLMQEHGLLERVLLIYDEAAGRIDQGQAVDLGAVAAAAGVVRQFVEEYHEQSEEKHVFPRLQKAGRQTALVEVLLRQHQRGREVTADIARLAGAGRATAELAQRMRAFQRMYRPHAAREDTVLFPAFREVMGRAAYRELGERFEEEEHRRFGEGGFEKNVAEVARLEAALGIADLARFTP